MPDTIQIAENDVLKIQLRSGTDSDRQSIILSVGEPGFTTDHKRLYIGDGTTAGGILVGNKYLGTTTDITSIGGNPKPGDLGYDTSRTTLYRFITGNGTSLENWQPISINLQAANNTLSVFNNTIKVNSLSAFNISSDALGNSLEISAGRVSLSSTIAVDQITSTNLRLSSYLNIGGQDYIFPGSQTANSLLYTDGSGNLEWKEPGSVFSTLTGLSARLSTGPGLSVFVNGSSTTEALLLTSSNVQIRGSHIPVSHVTFNQAGNITRSARVDSVATVTFNTLTAGSGDYVYFLNNVNGLPLQRSTSQYDAGYSGIYRVTLSDTFFIANSEIEVFIKNASYRGIDNTSTYFTNSNLNYNYFVIPTGGGDKFKELVIYFYSPSTLINFSNQQFTTGPGYITPGYSNNRTRFGISVYGDVE